MKRFSAMLSLGLAVLLAAWGGPALAACYESAEKLADELNVCERMNAGKATVQQVYACAKATGYLMGIADALDSKDFEGANAQKTSELKAMLQKYLKEHPAEKNLCADVLVREALTAAYPRK
jgi:hypothetical protein